MSDHVNRYSHTPRRVFEKAIDRLKADLQRKEGSIRKLQERMLVLEEQLK